MQADGYDLAFAAGERDDDDEFFFGTAMATDSDTVLRREEEEGRLGRGCCCWAAGSLLLLLLVVLSDSDKVRLLLASGVVPRMALARLKSSMVLKGVKNLSQLRFEGRELTSLFVVF